MKYRVVKITNNLADYPECRADTIEFPDLVQYVDDEMALFVVQVDPRHFWPAGEFFYMHDIDTFTTETN